MTAEEYLAANPPASQEVTEGEIVFQFFEYYSKSFHSDLCIDIS